MIDILNKILADKYDQLGQLRSAYRLGCYDNTPVKNRRSLIARLNEANHIQLIAEIKRGSPSRGLFAPDLNVTAQAQKYEKSGAAAISVLTDQKFFYGGFHDLQTVRAAVDSPILCKDFIVDELQIDIAYDLGATIILLIVAAHTTKRLKTLSQYAMDKGLEVLIEVHNEEELATALNLDHKLIGINNRDLKTFETSIDVSLKLIQSANRPDVHFISESGIQTEADVRRLIQAGFKGILVGESLIRDGLEGDLIKSLSAMKLKTKEGLTP